MFFLLCMRGEGAFVLKRRALVWYFVQILPSCRGWGSRSAGGNLRSRQFPFEMYLQVFGCDCWCVITWLYLMSIYSTHC